MASPAANSAYNTLEEAVWHDSEPHTSADGQRHPGGHVSPHIRGSDNAEDAAESSAIGARKPASRSKKAIAACTGAVTTSFLMTPFDVVKTRLQMQPPAEALFLPSQHLGPPRASAASGGTAGVKSAKALGKQPERIAVPSAQTSNATCCKPTFFASNLQGDALTCRYDPRLDRATSSFETAAAEASTKAGSTTFGGGRAFAGRSTPAAALQALHARGQPTQSSIKLSSTCAFPDRAIAKRVLLSGGTSTLNFADGTGQVDSQRQAAGAARAWNEFLRRIWSPRGAPQPSPALTTGSSTGSAAAHLRSGRLNGLWSGVMQVGRTEGMRGLWRGLTPTLLMTIPSQVTYMSCYDFFRSAFLSLDQEHEMRVQQRAVAAAAAAAAAGPGAATLRVPMRTNFEAVTTHSLLASLSAGALARSISATLVTPLELVRTRLQASSSRAGSGSSTNQTSLRGNLAALSQQVSREGYGVLWRGLGSTLWRDVPFSAIYFAGYEAMKRTLTGGGLGEGHASGHGHEFSVAFLSGAVSGSIAAVATHPFDLVKTRTQAGSASSRSQSTLSIVSNVHRTEGVSGLFRGLSPRIAKVAPACGVMIGSFEVVGRLLADT